MCVPAPATQWYLTCGDPVCGGHRPDPNVPPCMGEMPGAECGSAGTLCDPIDGCNARLLCTDADPRLQPGGCPISKAAFKRDIEHLSEAEVADVYAELRELRLARWTYRSPDRDGRRYLGFLLDETAAQSTVDQVDLYGYTSMAVAGLQAQARELETLRAEVEALKTACGVGREGAQKKP